MSRILSDRMLRRLLFAAALLLPGATVHAALPVSPTLLAMQDLARVVSSEVSLSSRDAGLRLEVSGGRALDVMFRDGALYIGDERIADVARGSELDRSWRELMTRVMDAPGGELPQMLYDWSPPGGAAGERLEAALDAVLQGGGTAVAAPGVPAPVADSLTRLTDRINELEATLADLEAKPPAVIAERNTSRRSNPFRHIIDGIAGIFSLIIVYAVLFAIAFGVIFFGGRKYIEGVADTARHATGRSLLVGMAASFLVVPAFLLGMIALIISIVGIPGILVWIPGFPVAFVLALLLGYLGVAHSLGESFAERRYYVTDWFQRGNSYYFLVSGLGLLLALFFAAQVVHMAGPWMHAIFAILMFLGVVCTILATLVGFGAVLISRAGTRPIRTGAAPAEEDLFHEQAGV